MRRTASLLALLLASPVWADTPVFSDFLVEVCRSTNVANTPCTSPRCASSGGVIHTTRPRFDVQATAAGVGFHGDTSSWPQPGTGISGVQGSWRFDGNGLDSSGSSNHITFVNPYGTGSSFEAAQSGLVSAWRPAKKTVGVNAGYATATFPFAFGGTDFSVELWVYRYGDACSGIDDVCTKDNWPILISCDAPATNRCLIIGLDNSQPTMRFSGNIENDDALSLTALSNNTWHHLAFVLEGTTKKIYVDGVQTTLSLVGTQAAYQGAAATMYIGGLPDGQNPTNWADRFAQGRFDSLRIYNRAITNEEIRTHRFTQYFSINSNQDFPGQDLAGQFSQSVPSGTNDWAWAFGARGSQLTSGVANTWRFGAEDSSENVGSNVFTATVVQTPSAMTPPAAPAVADVGVTSATWQIPTWACDSYQTNYTYSPTFAIASVSNSKTYATGNTLTPNTAYGLAARASYKDTGGSGLTVGPSAASLSVYTTTYANVPGAVAGVIPNGATSARVFLDLDSSAPNNPSDTDINVEGSTDGGSTFSTVSDYQPCNSCGFFNPRNVTGLAKSSRYYFRSRNRNRSGVVTAPGGTGLSTMITQPATPAGMSGAPATGGSYCPKTDLRWSWGAVSAGSGSPTEYDLRREDGTTLISSGNPSNFYVETGLTPNTQYQAVARAYDGGGPLVPYSEYSSTAAAATGGVGIAAPIGLAGTPAQLPFFFTTVPGITWNWSVPNYLCPNWNYVVVNAQTGVVISTLAANSAPTYNHYVFLPNVLASIQVRGIDSFATGTLSDSTTAYSATNAPASLSATSVSTGSLVLNWNANGNPTYTRYEVSLSTDNFATSISSPVSVGHDVTSAFAGISGLSPGTTYYLRVRAFNGRSSDSYGGVPGALSSVLALMTLTPASTLSATILGTTSLQWTWTASAGASGYRLFDDGGGPLIDTTGLSYTSSSLSANGAYGAYIEPYNGQGLGNRSATVYAFTNANAPTGLIIVTVSSNAVTYAWSGNGNPGYTFYEINVATDSIFQAVVATRNVTGTGLIADTLFPGTTYYARVRALNGGQSPTAYALSASAVTTSDPEVSLSSPPASVYTNASGLIGLWHLDENSGLSAADASTTGNPGALACLTNGCSSTPTFTGGPPDLGSAASLPGTSDSLIQVAHHASYAFTGSMSISAWVKPATTALADGAGIVAKGDGGGESFALDVVTSGAQKHYRFISRPGYVAVATSTIRVGQWDHVAGVFDDALDETRIYVNGVLSATTASPFPRVSPAHLVSIGARQSAGGAYDLAFAGSIDEVRLANVALSAAQVQAEFRGSYPTVFALPPPNDDVYLTFPPNAFGGSVVIYASNDPLNHPLRVGAVTLLGGLLNVPTGQAMAAGSLIEIVPAVAGVAFTGSLGSPATLSLPYPDSNNDGLVDGVSPQIAAGGLQVYTLNASIGRWEPLPTTVDRANHRAAAPTPHFSVFALFGPSTVGTALSQVRVYPVPWKPGSAGRFDAAALTFDLLPAEGYVRIFTLAGDQVVELAFSGADAGRITWNGRNAAGRSAASGVYFAYVRSAREGATTVLKFAVER